jgi:hypothetical protein
MTTKTVEIDDTAKEMALRTLMRKLEAPMKRTSRQRDLSHPRASLRRELARLEEIPNVGSAVAADLRRLGITSPGELLGCDPYAMYDDLCHITGKRHDPCLLDTFIAAVRFMGGEPKKPWWKYTAERKKVLASRSVEDRIPPVAGQHYRRR